MIFHLFFTIATLLSSSIHRDSMSVRIPHFDSIPPGYTLVWSDEFVADGRPDPKKWGYERGFVRNEELQWYQPENAFCKNGKLIIEGKRELVVNQDFDPSSASWKKQRKVANYTSASLTTKGIQAWTYGIFEIRAKLKTADGLWPAIWMLGINDNWPMGGEIDIMEYYGGNILANAAWAGASEGETMWDDVRIPVDGFTDPQWNDRYHIWRLYWDVDQMVITMDGEVLNTIELSKTVNGRGVLENPFHHPHFLILNLAIGGKAGGDPTKTEFPTWFSIDYVRVYQQQKE